MNRQKERQQTAHTKWRILQRWATGLLLLGTVAIAACQNPTKVRECLPTEEYKTLKQNPNSLDGKNEYEVLAIYGKPKIISMNTRSEKEYIFSECGNNSPERLIIKFSATGHVKEVYLKSK
jgi:hypothetical protein